VRRFLRTGIPHQGGQGGALDTVQRFCVSKKSNVPPEFVISSRQRAFLSNFHKIKQDMGKKLQSKEFDSIISVLSAKEQARLREQEITPEWLRENIAYCKGLMKRDMWFGPIWFVSYSVLMFVYGYTPYTVSIFLLGMGYFMYTIFKTGSFGTNRKRVQVYEQLLAVLEK
jgi:hypothetical protein